jgi:hypothetical protein
VLPNNSPTEAPLLWPPLLAMKELAPTVIRQTADNCGTVRCLIKLTRAVQLTGLSVQTLRVAEAVTLGTVQACVAM